MEQRKLGRSLDRHTQTDKQIALSPLIIIQSPMRASVLALASTHATLAHRKAVGCVWAKRGAFARTNPRTHTQVSRIELERASLGLKLYRKVK